MSFNIHSYFMCISAFLCNALIHIWGRPQSHTIVRCARFFISGWRLSQERHIWPDVRQVLIPVKALEMSAITWPKRYMEKGAQTVAIPKEILQRLAESHAFNKDIWKEEQSDVGSIGKWKKKLTYADRPYLIIPQAAMHCTRLWTDTLY